MAKQEYEYREKFNVTLTSILSEIVFYHVRSNNITLANLVRQLNEKGFKVSYQGLRSSLDNRNISCYNYIYWSRIFELLNIDFNKSNVIELYQIAKEYNKAYLVEYHSKRKKKL
jgi:hypothetical protein